MQPLPTHASIVIIGGGAIGTSIAWHLGRLGVEGVVLLERDRLTSGTTWHAAGLIASGGMSTETLIWIEQYTRQLYQQVLPAETGLSTGWRQCGHIHLACDPDRREVMKRDANFVRSQGLERFELSPAEIRQKFPLIETKGILSGFWTPADGRANPVDVTMAYAAGARARGVRLFEGTPVTDFVLNGTRVTGVVTPQGTITAEKVVLATGMWSRQLGAKIGVRVPLQAAEHYYLLTEPIPGMHPDMPVVEDPDTYTYVREEGGGMLFGLFEPEGATWNLNGIPGDASFSTLPPDWDRMTPFLEAAFERYPVMKTAGIKTFFCGPESFTPDGSYLMGEAPEVDGLYLATGLNSLGILSAGGVGHIWPKSSPPAPRRRTSPASTSPAPGLTTRPGPSSASASPRRWAIPSPSARCRTGTTRPRGGCAASRSMTATPRWGPISMTSRGGRCPRGSPPTRPRRRSTTPATPASPGMRFPPANTMPRAMPWVFSTKASWASSSCRAAMRWPSWNASAPTGSTCRWVRTSIPNG